MVTAMTPTGIPEDWWESVEDPDGYRLEVVQGELVMNPSPLPRHGRLQSAIYDALRPGVPDGYGLLADIEWRLKVGGRRPLIAAAPRPDLMVAPLAAEVIEEPPLLAVEVLSPSDYKRLTEHPELTRVEGKRLDYAAHGLRHYLEVDDDLVVVRYELQYGRLVPVWSGVAHVQATEPFPYELHLG